MIMKTKYIFSLLISFFISLQLAAQKPIIISHRGASGEAPENTLASIIRAKELNTDMIEIDVHLSKDGKLVIMHDYSVDRTTNAKGKIKELEYEYLRTLDAGSWFAEEFAGERILNLDEVMTVLHGDWKLLIEIKSPPENTTEIEKLVIEHIQRHQAHEWCIIQSFDSQVLDNVRFFDPKIEVHKLVVGNIPILPLHYDTKLRWGSIMKYSQYDAINPHYKFIGKSKIKRIQKRGQKVYSWTINKDKHILKMAAKGVDGIITNETANAINLLRK